jgi:ubiquinone/menaquinone biosynthesis C-methylase UbiE
MLDLGSGAGTDSLIAVQMVGEQGHVTGIDMTQQMLVKARAATAEMGASNVEFVESEAEQLPFADATFDVVISNGVIDLIPDKDAVFAELFREMPPFQSTTASGTFPDRADPYWCSTCGTRARRVRGLTGKP